MSDILRQKELTVIMAEKTESEAKLLFVSFCIEEYKTLHRMPGADAAALFEKYGVTDFLMEHFDILHTLGTRAILSEIDRFIESGRRKK